MAATLDLFVTREMIGSDDLFRVGHRAANDWAIHPVATLAYLTITNIAAHPIEIQQFRLEIQKENQQWIEYRRIATHLGGGAVFGVVNHDFKHANAVKAQLLDLILAEKILDPGIPVHGWLVYPVPGISISDLSRINIRLVLVDAFGIEVLPLPIPTRSPLRLPRIDKTSETVDLESAHARFEAGRQKDN